MIDKLRIEGIKEGIASYMYEQKVLLRLLRKKGKIMESEFDRLFSDYKTTVDERGFTRLHRRAPRLRFMPIKNAFLLGSPIQGDWGKWLHLTQLMNTVGLVQITEADGQYIYSPADQGLQLLIKR